MTIMMLAIGAMAWRVAAPLYAGGDDEVRERRIGAGAASESWRWQAADAADLPADDRERLLRHVDDCKPVDEGRRIPVTTSTGGAVPIDGASGKATFRAPVPMAHPAALLPAGLIAVALSIRPAGDGLDLNDARRSETPLQSVPPPSGHGAVRDARRTRPFALSPDLVQAFRLRRTVPGTHLEERARRTRPGRRDGHDLSSDAAGDDVVTTQDGVWRFPPDDGGFVPFAPLDPKREVEPISASANRIAWVQAEERWWAHGFTVMLPDGGDVHRIPVGAHPRRPGKVRRPGLEPGSSRLRTSALGPFGGTPGRARGDEI